MKKVTQDELNVLIAAHNAYADDEYYDHPPVDFGGCIYDGLTFQDAWMGWINFSGSVIRNCTFINCVLPINSVIGSGFKKVAELSNCKFINCDAFNITPIKGYFNRLELNGIVAIYNDTNVWVSNEEEDERYLCNHDLVVTSEVDDEELPKWFKKIEKAIYYYIQDNPVN